MGNQQEKGTESPKKSNEVTKENVQTTRLRSAFQRASGGGDILSLSCFQSEVFPLCPSYGACLYTAMLGDTATGGNACAELHEEQYITASLRLLELLTFSEQMQFYFKVFSKWKDEMEMSEFTELLGTCHNISWTGTGLEVHDLQRSDQPFIDTVHKSLFGSQKSVTCGDVTAWCQRQCPQTLQTLHSCTTASLSGNIYKTQDMGASAVNEAAALLVEGKLLLSPPTMCMLSYLLPMTYIPASDTIKGDPLAAIATICQLDDIVAVSGWNLLYDSNAQGLSVIRFQHHIMAYEAPTVLVLEFTDHIYCVAIDTEWSESGRRWGGLECKLVQLKPQYKVMQAGENMMFYNMTDRKVPKGIQFGKDARTTFLSIDDEMHNVKHYGVEFRLQRLEVWGCGGPAALQAQKGQHEWENKEAHKAKNRKLKIEVDEWKDSPDRQILEMGGVATEHAER